MIELVWSPHGYPAAAAYRDRHNRTEHHHRPWANDGSVYDPDRAAAQVRADARDFVSRARARVEHGGLCVCALDTELLGDWWHEGCDWLAAVVVEAGAQGLELVRLDDALASAPAVGAPELPVTTWGRGRDLSTWDGPQVADLVWHARRAELDVLAAGAAVPERAVRELLAMQSSDWAFQVTEASAGPYPRERAEGHRRALVAALAGREGGPAVRHLAPHLSVQALLEP
jgi:1,4-alpha-glucan branching enzyme